MDRDLIDAYVGELRCSLAWRRDIDDVGDEVADHLRENVARLVAAGIDPDEAQRRTLTCFGDLGVVARSFAQSVSGSLAAPTPQTRRAGALGLAAAAAWLASIVAATAGGHTDLLTTWTLERYWIWTAILVTANALTTIALAGVFLRGGGLRRPVVVIALALGALATTVLGIGAWAVMGVMTVFSVAVLLASRPLSGAADPYVRPVTALGAAWPLGFTSLLLGDKVLRLGPADDYGDHSAAWLIPFVVAAACSALVLTIIGRRLRAERVLDVADLPAQGQCHTRLDGMLMARARADPTVDGRRRTSTDDA